MTSSSPRRGTEKRPQSGDEPQRMSKEGVSLMVQHFRKRRLRDSRLHGLQQGQAQGDGLRFRPLILGDLAAGRIEGQVEPPFLALLLLSILVVVVAAVLSSDLLT
ncbi:hypothetical protein K435DRAFT_797826 [Dendrothele bispora CBS 962.96]|uniref:Uncharacterized protein n=1 Tax=Dendrothele bispora (strain CBS 962.96) TaxID=1314807 RepID=A0A4S8M157_DENBC|nr:hypothetical protein K435DRAFT_797826 [Dendrothele bispora CBS 962.96]